MGSANSCYHSAVIGQASVWEPQLWQPESKAAGDIRRCCLQGKQGLQSSLLIGSAAAISLSAWLSETIRAVLKDTMSMLASLFSGRMSAVLMSKVMDS